MPKKIITNEKLARMIKRGFDETATKQELRVFSENTDKQFKEVDRQFKEVDRQFKEVKSELAYGRAEMAVMSRDVAEIRKHFVYRDEFEDALARILLLEKKLGIKSGK